MDQKDFKCLGWLPLFFNLKLQVIFYHLKAYLWNKMWQDSESISSEVLCDLRLRETIWKDRIAWKEERKMWNSQSEAAVGSRPFWFGHNLSRQWNKAFRNLKAGWTDPLILRARCLRQFLCQYSRHREVSRKSEYLRLGYITAKFWHRKVKFLCLCMFPFIFHRYSSALI